MRNILIVHPCAQIFNIPCIVNLINKLGKTRSRVFFPIIKNNFFDESKESISNKIELSEFPFIQKSRTESLLVWFFGYLIFCIFTARKDRPEIIVAMGSKGLIVGTFLSYFYGAKLCFYSLEFPACPPRNFKDRIHFFLERSFCKNVDILFIHDDNRLKLYENIVSRVFEDFIIFPNAPVETLADDVCVFEVRKAYGIPKNKKVILYSGGLYSDIGLEKICEDVESLDKSWVLFLQSHDGVVQLRANKKIAQLEEQGRVIINLRPLSTNHYSALLQICSVGIAYYSAKDPNMFNVGLSSGKIAAYWKNGMPVIVNDLPVIQEIFNEFSCGVISDSLNSISDAVAIIDKSRDQFIEGAFAAYKKHFSLKNIEFYLEEMFLKKTRID
ncbi:MAG: hypothetical protein CL855_00760 [Cryomorphaceae bacterium]|nr:hypothetical protein [Cryomorphaceae bacterium]